MQEIPTQPYRSYKPSQNMLIAKTKQELQAAITQKKEIFYQYQESRFHNFTDTSLASLANLCSIGLTPTMGALHNGHKSLIEKNVCENHIAIVSIFVNPTQFSPTEDLAKYPRTLEKDLEMCENLGVDIVFLPNADSIYEEDEITLQPPKRMGYILEGYYRPTHFSGVLQIVLKLFNLTNPTRAYFGRKDAQQLLIIQKMAQQLCLSVQVIGMPIIRDYDNLALSSRNVYLDSMQRKQALVVPKIIFHLQSLITQQHIRDIALLKQEIHTILKSECTKVLYNGLEQHENISDDAIIVDYMDFYTHDLRLANEARNCIFLLAIKIKNIRLLDNLWIE